MIAWLQPKGCDVRYGYWLAARDLWEMCNQSFKSYDPYCKQAQIEFQIAFSFQDQPIRFLVRNRSKELP